MRTVILGLLIFMTVILGAQTQKEVASEVKAVTVFRQRAQVERSARTSIPAGNTILRFTDITPNLHAQSIQVQASGNFTILSVNHKLDYLQEAVDNAEVEQLKATKEQLEEERAEEQAVLQVYQEEENLLLANKSIGSQQTGVKVTDLQQMAAYFQKRLREIKLEKLELGKKIKKLEEEIAKVQNQLNQLSNNRSKQPTSVVFVAVNSERATNGDFQISYLVNNAGWAPTYDLRVKDIASPIKLDYKANVYQQSGEDWAGVQLSLSTGNPTQSGTRPELGPWRLDYYVAPGYASRYLEGKVPGVKLENAEQDQIALYDSAQPSSPLQVEQVENTTSMEFKIAVPYDIPSDGQPYVATIESYELPANYEYYVAPKLDTDAFLTAQLTNWEQYNLLTGQANLYFEGTYLGQSVLNTQSVDDTLTVSLGRDKGIIVTRTKQKDYSDKQFIGNKTTDQIGWEIELRNKKSQAIDIVVVDQFPVSVREEIEVKLEEAKKAEVDETTGKLTWRLNLKPNEQEKLNFRYSVKYPKKGKVMLE